MHKRLDITIKAIKEAAVEINSLKESFEIDFKDINDIVTDADIKSERKIKEIILKYFPNDNILSEESSNDTSLELDNLWIIDPLDGTNNFANGIPQYSISIAYAKKGEIKGGAVYDPSKRELFYAEKDKGAFLNGKRIVASGKNKLDQSIVCTGFYYDRGMLMRKTLKSIEKLFESKIRGLRRMGSAAIDLCWTACGRFDAYFEYELNPWDFAAGILILREAGGVALDNTGNKAGLKSDGLIVSGVNLIDEFLNIVKWDRRD